MKKIFTIFIIAIISQVYSLSSYAGSDESLEINNQKKDQSAEVKDCFETVNRGIFAFNQGLDKIFFKPVAKGYRYLPKPIRSGTSNALSNLSSVVTIPNNILQGQFKEAGINSLRFSINVGSVFSSFLQSRKSQLFLKECCLALQKLHFKLIHLFLLHPSRKQREF